MPRQSRKDNPSQFDFVAFHERERRYQENQVLLSEARRQDVARYRALNREHRRGEELASLFHRYELKLKQVMLDILAPEMGEIAAEVVQAALQRGRNGQRD